MKMNPKLIKTALLLATLAALPGCDEKVEYKEEALNFDIEQDLQSALQKNQMPQLAARLNCTACHAMSTRVYGPAWKDVGKRYQNAVAFAYQGRTYPLVEGLVQKVSHGGSGNWGSGQMPAIDPSGAKRDQIEKLVRFILEAGKQ